VTPSIRTGGIALAAASLLTLLVLHRTPASVVDAATAGLQQALYFVTLPAFGLLAGGYAATDRPYGAVPLFVLGSYVGTFGLGLVFGTLLTPGPAGPLLAVGLLLSSLAVVTLVASAGRLVAVLGFASLEPTDSVDGDGGQSR
jgi:hypothetical protein